jgi:UDP:flavonoid glycosyltransferase YjiC (YdhE family)
MLYIRTHCSKIYTIGPFHALLKLKLGSETTTLHSQSSNSLFEVYRSCMTWLDAQPFKSVIYVSFGSTTTTTKDVLMEFWHNLVSSKKRFLWVIRPDLVDGNHADGQTLTPELVERTKEKGYMVGWAPQAEVLAHPTIGGFLTHSGWNPTIESIMARIPMICWPYLADQQVNSWHPHYPNIQLV